MSVVKHFIEDSIKKTEIDEFLSSEFERAGYGGVSITKTPLGTHLVIYTMRPGLVIGRGGETIRALSAVLEENFQLPSPQISVAEIEVPELNAYVVASRIASAMKRGIHYRRAGFWGLTQAMQAGAQGIEIVISGKLRTDRARYEKFTEGYLPKSGEPARQYTRKAELHVQLKPGILGVKVRLIPPEAVFPDQVKVHLIEEPVEEPISESTVPATEEKIESDQKAVETKVPSAEDAAATEMKEGSPVDKIVVAEQKVEEAKVPVAESKVVTEKKVVTTEAQSVEKPLAEKKIEQKVAEKPVPVEDKAVTEAKTVPNVEKKVVTEKKVAKTKTPTTQKIVADKNVTKTKAQPVAKKAVAEQKVAKKVAKKPVVADAKEKVATKKKIAKPAVAPVEEKKAAKKKVAKTVAPSAEEKKEAGT